MAYAMTKQGSLDNCITYEFICDTVADMNAIEDRYRSIGSVAIVLQGESDGLEVYIAGSDKNWNSLSSAGADSSATGGLSIYICGQDEVDELTGLPDIAEPDETSIYLVPAGETSGNLYEEYIYVDDAWEKFGSASIDLSGYAPIANPNFTDSVSLDRYTNSTVGTLSVALGRQTQATGNYSFAEGNYTTASGSGAHAEGQSTVASAYNAHAEGLQTKARGNYSHAEGKWDTGNQTITYDNTTYYYGASGVASHSEGANTIAHANASHAEGDSTKALDLYAHAEGNGTVASGEASHAEGESTTASGENSHTEGKNTQASGRESHTEGKNTIASGDQAHAEGLKTVAAGNYSHAEGYKQETGTFIYNNVTYNFGATGVASHSEGKDTIAKGESSHAEGYATKALADKAHAEGASTIANGLNSHAEGSQTTASGAQSHAEGAGSFASAAGAHAEGAGTTASGNSAHAEGSGSVASGYISHAEGMTKAIGYYQHTSGKFNVVDSASEWQTSTSYQIGDLVSRSITFTDGSNTARTRTVIYKCKTANSDSTFNSSKWEESGIYAEIIGNGTADDARSNARALDWDGNEYLKGDLYVGCNADSTGGTKVATTAQLSGYAPIANPTFTGSISLGRKADTTVGTNSLAIGDNTTASGNYSQAMGDSTTASGSYAHAEGTYTYATDSTAHAEGYSTKAQGRYSHSENIYTIADGYSTHASGVYNKTMTIYPDWTANTSYAVGDGCAYSNFYYKCIQANNDSEFDASKWAISYYINSKEAFVVGNGTANNARSNALTLDWTGDLHLMGDLYTGANANGTGGTKLARIPDAPSTDGTYTLQCVVSSGVPTYSWISTGA